MTRTPSITQRVTWQTAQQAEMKFYIGVGFDQTGALTDVRYADGQKYGTDLQATISDGCAMISRLFRAGATVESLRAELTDPPSILGAILDALAQGEAEGWA